MSQICFIVRYYRSCNVSFPSMEAPEIAEKFQMSDRAFLLYFIHMYVINNYFVESLICLNLCRQNGNWQCNFPVKIANGWLSSAIYLLPIPFIQISYATRGYMYFENSSSIFIHPCIHASNWFACSFCSFQICICCIKFFIFTPKWLFHLFFKNLAGVG